MEELGDDPEEGPSKVEEENEPPRKRGFWRRKPKRDKAKEIEEEEEWINSKGKMEEDTSETRMLPVREPSRSIEESVTEGGVTPHPVVFTTATVLMDCSGGTVRIGMVPFCCHEGTKFKWRDYTPGYCVFCNTKCFELRWMGSHGDKGKDPIMQDSLVRSSSVELPGKYKVALCRPCFEKYGTYFWIGRNDIHEDVCNCSMSNLGVQCCSPGITCRLRPIAMLAFNYDDIKWGKEELAKRYSREWHMPVNHQIGAQSGLWTRFRKPPVTCSTLGELAVESMSCKEWEKVTLKTGKPRKSEKQFYHKEWGQFPLRARQLDWVTDGTKPNSKEKVTWIQAQSDILLQGVKNDRKVWIPVSFYYRYVIKGFKTERSWGTSIAVVMDAKDGAVLTDRRMGPMLVVKTDSHPTYKRDLRSVLDDNRRRVSVPNFENTLQYEDTTGQSKEMAKAKYMEELSAAYAPHWGKLTDKWSTFRSPWDHHGDPPPYE